MNNEFLRQYKRISKKHGGDLNLMAGDLRECFERALGDFPEEMAEDLAATFIPENPRDEDIQRAADITDLHNGELEQGETVLREEDWTYIKEMVNSYAADLDMDWVSGVMQIIIDLGVL